MLGSLLEWGETQLKQQLQVCVNKVFLRVGTKDHRNWLMTSVGNSWIISLAGILWTKKEINIIFSFENFKVNYKMQSNYWPETLHQPSVVAALLVHPRCSGAPGQSEHRDTQYLWVPLFWKESKEEMLNKMCNQFSCKLHNTGVLIWVLCGEVLLSLKDLFA